ncbi:MAG: ester cyclase [Anaerolineales bacterium]
MPDAASLVRLIFEQAFNQGDLDVVDDLVAADVTAHFESWGIPASRLGFKQMIANLRSAFPDLHCTVEDEIIQGDKFAARWMMSGSHQGSFFGNLPTRRRIEVQGFIFTCIVEGKIGENWILIDQMGLLQQLGVVPPARRRI